MSPEERQMISGLFDRVRDAERAPRDGDAEAYIASRAKESPNAAYTLAQVVLVQEQALGAAQRRIEELEAELREAQQHSAPQPQQGGGFLSSIFGGGAQARPSGPSWSREPQRPPQGHGRQGYGAPPPQQGGPWGGAPQQQGGPSGGPWGGQQGFGAAQQPARGGGFLSGALTTAAGVAGGMMLANSIQGLFKSDPQLAETAGANHQTAAADQSALSDVGSSNDVWPADQGEMRDGGFHNASSSYDDGGMDDGGGFDDGGFDDV